VVCVCVYPCKGLLECSGSGDWVSRWPCKLHLGINIQSNGLHMNLLHSHHPSCSRCVNSSVQWVFAGLIWCLWSEVLLAGSGACVWVSDKGNCNLITLQQTYVVSRFWIASSKLRSRLSLPHQLINVEQSVFTKSQNHLELQTPFHSRYEWNFLYLHNRQLLNSLRRHGNRRVWNQTSPNETRSACYHRRFMLHVCSN